jgi:hypothetical protein
MDLWLMDIFSSHSLQDMPDIGVSESLVLENSSTSDATDDSEFIKDQFHSNFTTSVPNPNPTQTSMHAQQPSNGSFVDTSFGEHKSAWECDSQ